MCCNVQYVLVDKTIQRNCTEKKNNLWLRNKFQPHASRVNVQELCNPKENLKPKKRESGVLANKAIHGRNTQEWC